MVTRVSADERPVSVRYGIELPRRPQQARGALGEEQHQHRQHDEKQFEGEAPERLRRGAGVRLRGGQGGSRNDAPPDDRRIKARSFSSDSNIVVASTPEEFAALIKAEISKWANVVKSAGIAPE